MIDILFVILMIAALVKGYRQGLVLALFSIVAYIIGMAAALKLSAVAAVYLQQHIAVPPRWLPFIAFAAVFIAVVIAVNWAGRLLQKTFELAMLGWLNRLGGIIFFAALYGIIFSIFLFYAEKINLLTASAIRDSLVYPFIKPWGPAVMNSFASIIPLFKDMFTQLESFFETASGKLQQ